MPILIKSIQGNVLDNVIGNVYCFSSITGEAQFEDYINLNGFIAYLQNFKRVETLTKLEKPLKFGLKNQYNLPTTTLEISY
jgi:hypothetical protein